MTNRLAFWKGTEKDKEIKRGGVRRRGHLSSMFGFDQKKYFFRIKEKHLSYPQLSERESVAILSRYVSRVATLPGHCATGTLCVESAVSAEGKGAKPHAMAS